MELKELISIIRKNWQIVVALSVTGVVLALFLTAKMSKNYVQTQTLFVSAKQQPPDTTSTSPAYYDQEKARNFTDTAVAILQSPDFKNSVLGPGESTSTKKEAAQVLTITASAPTPEAASQLMEKTITTFNNNLVNLNNQETLLKQVGKNQEPHLPAVNRKVYLLAGLLLGLAASVAAISLKTYFRL